MAVLTAIQVALPLLFVVWLALWPPPTRAAIVALAAAAALLITAGALAGLWIAAPWWTPLVQSACLTAALIAALKRAPRRVWPYDVGGWAMVTLPAACAAFGALTALDAWAGRATPPGRTVALAWPLPASASLIVNGGSTAAVSAHVKTLDESVPRYAAWRGQSYGVDVVGLNAWGLAADGVMPESMDAWAIYGDPVVSPCAGQVIAATDGRPDQPIGIPDEGNRGGNFVVLRCADAGGPFDVLLAHLRPGSVRAKPGDVTFIGQRLGEAGNSGASDAPHLHIHAQEPGTPEQPFSGAPLPMTFSGRYLVRNDRVVPD